MPTLHLNPKTDEKSDDFIPKLSLLRRFAAQIAPSLDEQHALMRCALSQIALQALFVELYLRHIHIKTTDQPKNAELDFLFHGFTPSAEENPETPNPSTYKHILNLIQFGHPVKTPETPSESLLSAPFWHMPQLTELLIEVLCRETLFTVTAFSGMLTGTEASAKDGIPRLIAGFKERFTSISSLLSSGAEDPSGSETPEDKAENKQS